MDVAIPPSHELFEPVADRRGPRLAIVLGNQAEGGVCPWARAGRCHHCDIGLGEGRALDDAANLRRLRWLEERYAEALPGLTHLVIYDSGSTLNPKELSPAVLAAALALARRLPRLRCCSLDSREPFVREAAVRAACRALGPGRLLHVILGIESADDAIRDGLLDKGMPREAIERAAGALAAVRREALAESSEWAELALPGLSVNIVIAGPGTTPDTAVADALGTARYALDLAARHALPLDLNLHPYYPSRRGLARFGAHPRCAPDLARAATAAIAAIAGELGDRALVFVGWQDEGHDQEPSTRASELAATRAWLDRFNRTGDLGA